MINLNKQFKEAIIESNYYYSNFDGKKYKMEDLQICHILSNSKRTLNSIKNTYLCSKKEAEIIMNMPLLNTVVGTREDNKYYKKTDDIVFINKHLIRLVKSNIDIPDKMLKYKIIREYYSLLFMLDSNIDIKDDVAVEITTNAIKDLQYSFQREIDLHI